MLRNNLVLTNAVADSVRKKISTAFKLGKRLVCVLLFKTVISITSLSDIRMYFETVINIREKKLLLFKSSFIAGCSKQCWVLSLMNYDMGLLFCFFVGRGGVFFGWWGCACCYRFAQFSLCKYNRIRFLYIHVWRHVFLKSSR